MMRMGKVLNPRRNQVELNGPSPDGPAGTYLARGKELQRASPVRFVKFVEGSGSRNLRLTLILLLVLPAGVKNLVTFLKPLA